MTTLRRRKMPCCTFSFEVTFNVMSYGIYMYVFMGRDILSHPEVHTSFLVHGRRQSSAGVLMTNPVLCSAVKLFFFVPPPPLFFLFFSLFISKSTAAVLCSLFFFLSLDCIQDI